MKKMNVNVKVTEDGEVAVSLSEEVKSRIPRPGDRIYVIQPYNPNDDDDDTTVLVIPRKNEVKESPILAYSYDAVFVKASSISDDMEVVTVNGDYRIPLYKNTTESVERKIIVLSNEEEAREKWRTLMNTSLEEAARRRKLAVDIEEYIREALEKEHH